MFHLPAATAGEERNGMDVVVAPSGGVAVAGPGAPGAAAATPAMDEARRQRLRQLELRLARLEGELEERGLPRAQIEER